MLLSAIENIQIVFAHAYVRAKVLGEADRFLGLARAGLLDFLRAGLLDVLRPGLLDFLVVFLGERDFVPRFKIN